MLRLDRRRPSLAATALSALLLTGVAVGAQETHPRIDRPLDDAPVDRAACEKRTDAVYVEPEGGAACVVFAVAGKDTGRRAVFYFHGDIPAEDFRKSGEVPRIFKGLVRQMERPAEKYGLRYVVVSRPGVNGSSGSHSDRRRKREPLIMSAAVDAIKAKLGLDEVILTGQSGGASVAASLLTLGRTDVTCAVLGSGRFNVVDDILADRVRQNVLITREVLDELEATYHDPSHLVSRIAPSQARRIFVIGDLFDTITSFNQQKGFAELVKRAGHHVTAFPVAASGKEKHGVTHHSINASGMCAAGRSDAEIQRDLQSMPLPAIDDDVKVSDRR